MLLFGMGELVRIGVGHEVGHEESIYRNLDLIVNSPIGFSHRSVPKLA